MTQPKGLKNPKLRLVISFIIASMACALAGLCYSELAAMISIVGSAYTFAYATMGELIVWAIGWTLVDEKDVDKKHALGSGFIFLWIGDTLIIRGSY